MTAAVYPVRVDARLEPGLSRWLWAVKFFLAIPHFVVLALLWVAFVVLSMVAFVAILFTGRYPRAIFDFNVGVLRWSWRVHYYSFGALATDRYPPFTLQDVPDYPARLEVSYPEHLSRGLVLVKWWLLALPHYVVVAVFLGGGTWAAWRGPGGLIGVLVVIAAVMLAVTGRYPKQIYDFVLGMNRWALRVAAYAGLMTDEYPPFRLDMGGDDPAGTLTLDPGVRAAPSGEPVAPGSPPAVPPPPPPPPPRGGWTAGRVVAVVAGALAVVVGLGLGAGGGAALWADNNRDGGYVTSDVTTQQTSGYALVSERVSIGGARFDWGWERHIIGTLRVRVTNDRAGTPVFVGIAAPAAVSSYLAGVAHGIVNGFGSQDVTSVGGVGPHVPPGDAGIWVASASGTGTSTLTWPVRAGDWEIVVMNADASAPVAVSGDIGATFPSLGWIAAGLFLGAAVLLALALALIVVPVMRAGRRSP